MRSRVCTIPGNESRLPRPSSAELTNSDPIVPLLRTQPVTAWHEVRPTRLHPHRSYRVSTLTWAAVPSVEVVVAFTISMTFKYSMEVALSM